MTVIERERRRLLRLFQQTRDRRFLDAAHALKPTLLERVRDFPRRGRPASSGKESVIGPRLSRMACEIIAGEARNATDAARREVDQHGVGAYPSRETAIDVLSTVYRRQRQSREDEVRYLSSLAQYQESITRTARVWRAITWWFPKKIRLEKGRFNSDAHR